VLLDDDASRAEQPRERLWAEGVEALSACELLALVLRTGAPGQPVLELARGLWERFGSLERLARAGDAELAALGGMGPAKTAALRAALELGARAARAPLRAGERLVGPEQVFAHLAPRMIGLRQERFLALLLDSRQRVIREVEVSRGSLDQSLVHPREVFGPALREAAAALVVAHNHPSGDPEPSAEDREVTSRLASAGQILGVALLDHVVVGGAGYVSFARRGWLQAQVVRKERR
jgi:DNA repair protein RadC